MIHNVTVDKRIVVHKHLITSMRGYFIEVFEFATNDHIHYTNLKTSFLASEITS